MTILPSQRHLFALPLDVTYFNCAYMSPLSNRVAQAGREGIDAKQRPWEITPADFFTTADRGRAAFARLLGSPATADDVAIVPAASYGMATAAANLPLRAGQRVLVLAEEFPSTVLTWRARAREVGAELVTIPRPADDDWTPAVLAAIDSRTAVAALPACHWIDGVRLDLTAIRSALSAVGAALVLDLTQSLGVMPFDLAAADPDFLVAACYKWLLGPYSIGLLYVAPRRQNGAPLEQHWFGRAGSENFSALLGYPDAFQPGARRFDMGEPANFALIPPAVAAVEQILEWGVGNISETIGAYNNTILARAEALGATAVPPRLRAPHYLSLRIPIASATLAEQLAAARVYVSARGGGTLRITPHVYSEPHEIDRFFSVLEPALRLTGRT
ncbi:MAG: aminotransferase class V-fold PLP-dependent enzyme [Gemmatimonadales bacterium]